MNAVESKTTGYVLRHLPSGKVAQVLSDGGMIFWTSGSKPTVFPTITELLKAVEADGRMQGYPSSGSPLGPVEIVRQIETTVTTTEMETEPLA